MTLPQAEPRSLAVASRGLFATGVSTDINISYISSGGKIGDVITMEAECDKLGTILVRVQLIQAKHYSSHP